MTLTTLLKTLRATPDKIEFTDVIAVIEATYTYAPTAFRNGGVQNAAGQNAGACKVLAFARLQGLSESETLACFGRYYREDVLQHPDASDHPNIRHFMQSGWAGVVFEGDVLT